MPVLLKFILFFFCSVFLKILTYFLSPLLSLISVVFKRNVLPYPLNLFHTHDDTLDGGQNQLNWPPAKGFKLWKQRMLWMCRNPAYGFEAYWFGLPKKGTKVTFYKIEGDPKEAYLDYRHTLEHKGKKYFSYRRKWTYPKTNRAFRIWFGWNPWSEGDNYKLKASFHPFKRNHK